MSIVAKIERAFLLLRRRNVEPARIWLAECDRITLEAELSLFTADVSARRRSYKGVPITVERIMRSRVVASDGQVADLTDNDLSNKNPKT